MRGWRSFDLYAMDDTYLWCGKETHESGYELEILDDFHEEKRKIWRNGEFL